MKNIDIIHQRDVLGQDFKIYGDMENPLFLAKDVAVWIDYSISNVSKLVNMVDDEEKVRNITTTLGGNQEAWFLTEDGLYEVLMQSRKPIAKQFKKEVKKLLKDLRLNRFNPFEGMSKEVQAIIMLDKKQQELESKVHTVQNNIEDFKGSMPLFNVECDELSAAVKKKGVHVLGGYKTPAYNDKSLRSKVYIDIHNQIKREFGLHSYKAIKRSELEIAKEIILDYKVPRILEDEIICLNNQVSFH